MVLDSEIRMSLGTKIEKAYLVLDLLAQSLEFLSKGEQTS